MDVCLVILLVLGQILVSDQDWHIDEKRASQSLEVSLTDLVLVLELVCFHLHFLFILMKLNFSHLFILLCFPCPRFMMSQIFLSDKVTLFYTNPRTDYHRNRNYF